MAAKRFAKLYPWVPGQSIYSMWISNESWTSCDIVGMCNGGVSPYMLEKYWLLEVTFGMLIQKYRGKVLTASALEQINAV